MKLFIPELGTKLKLTKNWSVSIMNESRNYSILDAFTGSNNKLIRKVERIKYNVCDWQGVKANPLFSPRHCYGMSFEEAVKFYNENRHLLLTREEKIKNWGVYKDIIIPSGAILEVDRIYIRQGNLQCSSVTFKWRKDKKVLRFWANLEDVNKIEAEVVGEIEENRKKRIRHCSIGG
jgi:hypothetical protein